MQEINSDTKSIIRNTAQKAAKAAAKDYNNNELANASHGNGAVALYTWGTLAIVCALYAGAAGIFPSLNVTKSQSRILAQNANSFEEANEEHPDVVIANLPPPSRPMNSLPVQMSHGDFKLPENVDRIATGSISRNSTPINTHVGTKIEAAKHNAPSLNLGAMIGQSSEIKDLAVRYTALHRRAPDIFSGLKPLVRSGSGEQQLTSLIAGPFDTKAELASFCREVRLQLTVDCASTSYGGKRMNGNDKR